MNLQNRNEDTMSCGGEPRKRVAVIYHFFAHYRAAVMQTLLDSKDPWYLLVGDRSDPDHSIEPWQPPVDRFVVTPCHKLSATLLWQTGVVRMAMRPEIDVLIFLGNVNMLSTWIAACLARLLGKRVLFWTHGWIRHEQGVKATIRNLFYRLAHGLLLYGDRAKQIGRSRGFQGQTLHVIYNSLDYETQKTAREKVTLQRIQEVRQRCFPHSKAPVLICTSRLTPLRGLDLVMSAMAALRKQHFETSLLLVGDGPEREALARMANDLGLSVHFYGPCYDECRLAELIMSSNVAVAPGKVGLTAMHCLAYGTPVITHDDPDDQMPEWEAIRPGQTGDFFKRGDIDDLAEKVRTWCQHPWPDEGLRSRCWAIIERRYNPQYQRSLIDRAVMGLPAG